MTKNLASGQTNCSTPQNDVFQIFEGLGPQIRSQMLSLAICVGVGSRVWPKSAWSPSYEKKVPEKPENWTTPSNINIISLKMRFSKNTHKLDLFTIQTTAKRDDVSMPILKVSPGQDLGTQLQKKSWRNPPNASQKWYLPILIGAL